MKLPLLDTEQRLRLVQYRNNLLITLMEIKDYAKAKHKPVDKSVDNNFIFSPQLEANILTEIYYISILTEQQTFENKYRKDDGIETELLKKTAMELYNLR